MRVEEKLTLVSEEVRWDASRHLRHTSTSSTIRSLRHNKHLDPSRHLRHNPNQSSSYPTTRRFKSRTKPFRPQIPRTSR